MNIISGIGESGFLAHSAFSAGIATKDSNGNDITATYLTGVDLTPYQTTAGMTAYLTTGDSAEFMTTAERSDYIPTGVSSEFYTTANTANYISEVPDTYLQNTDLSTADGKVTAISGIPLSAGGDVPEGVMVESGIEYNSQGYINGYSGSAIATIDQERQWFTHDDTLCHVSNSAQYAIGINMSAISADLARMMGVDETVLFVTASYNNQLSSIPLSEPISAFDRIRIYDSKEHTQEYWWDAAINVNSLMFEHNTSGNRWITYWNVNTATTQNITYVSGWLTNVSASVPIATGYQPIPVGAPYGRFVHPMKVVGIGRKN